MKHSLLILLTLAATAAACTSGGTSTGVTTTTSPSATLTTETFSGTVPVGGSDFHSFVVAQAGELTDERSVHP